MTTKGLGGWLLLLAVSLLLISIDDDAQTLSSLENVSQQSVSQTRARAQSHHCNSQCFNLQFER